MTPLIKGFFHLFPDGAILISGHIISRDACHCSSCAHGTRDESLPMKRTHVYWICQVGGWGLLFAITIVLNTLRHGFSSTLVLNQGIVVVVGLAMTHLFRTYVHVVGWKAYSPRELAPRVVGSSVLMGVLFHGLFILFFWIGLYEPTSLESSDEFLEVSRQMGSVFGISLFFFLWSVIYFGIHYFRNYRQAEIDKWKLEAQAESARLKALKLQLNPHFFFNSLNSVRALIAEDPERAQRMVTRLARLLRSTLQVDDVKTVPLEEELSTVRTYLELETVRFEERLQYRIDASEEARGRPVPFLMIQTLVENGIKHGIATRQEGGTITIDADVRDGALRLQITNPGTVTSEEGGVGLENARERLRLLFGEEASLTIQNGTPDTVVARVVLPDREWDPPTPAAADRSAEKVPI